MKKGGLARQSGAVIGAEGRGMRLQLLTCKESAEGQLGKHQGLVSTVDRKTVGKINTGKKNNLKSKKRSN